MQKEPLKINVNKQVYLVTPVLYANTIQYKIETGCDYMFTLLQVNGEWQIKENDVKPFDDELIYNIGKEIELHELD